MSQLIVRVFYNLALFLLLVLGLPWWLLKYATSERFREGLGERFFGPSKKFAASLSSGPRIWLHAVSVGEVLAISGLVRELETRAPDVSIVISTTTRTGQALARERFGEEHCFYFPLDFPWSVRAAIHRLRPAMLVLAESELWPNVLTVCESRRIPVVMVNARISDRSLPRYRKLRFLWPPFLRLVTAALAQTEQDALRLGEIGIPAERVKVGGNLKYDVRAPQASLLNNLLQRHLAPGIKLLVCGSTLDGEEALLLDAWTEISRAMPNAVMVIAPRHPERFDKVAAMLAASPFCWTRRSQWGTSPMQMAGGSVFLLDSIGELASLYSLATVAFVGGSLVAAGGHNPLEPAQFGVCVTMGPHYENFRAIVELLIEQNAMRVVEPVRLSESLLTLLQQDAADAVLGANAKRVFTAQAGATSRAADVILGLLAASSGGRQGH